VVKGAARALSSPTLIENYVRGGPAHWACTRSTRRQGLAESGSVPEPVKPLASLADIHSSVLSRCAIHWVREIVRISFRPWIANKVLHDTWMRRAQQGDTVAMERIQAIGGTAMF